LATASAGTHCILELYGCPSDLLNDVLCVRAAVEEASRRSMSTLLKLSSHQFQPQGVTAIALLAESHISIHTWPEHGYAAVDVFTCGENADPRRACLYVAERLAAREYELTVLSRGQRLSATCESAAAGREEEQVLCPARS